ncbi:MAG: hypothetical protein L6Q57_05955 [Alphaproteobacteria bacterium]|nr:hypothetical protein [Alphaproteobacteria bacterium]
MGNYFLSLSLFVILLCFFIVLGANSTFEQNKAGAVMNSMAQAFASKDNNIRKISALPASADALHPHDGSVIGRVQGAFESQLPAADISQNRFGNSLRVRMDVKTFEAAVSEAALSGVMGAEQPSLRPVLLALIDGQESPDALRMDMVFEIPDNPALFAAQEAPLLADIRQRSLAMARNLENAGLPASLLSVGVGRGQEGYVVLYFQKIRAGRV